MGGKSTMEPDGAFVWKQAEGEARIVMYSEDKRVKIIGRPNQVRSLVVIVAPFTEAQPTLGVAIRQAESGPYMPDGRAPSDAFAPQSQMKSTGAEHVQSTEAQNTEPETLVGRIRLVEQDFE